ncbi:polyphosphate kinase 1 [Acidimicrobiia bacterium EGI L10123]|uniref:polyphosphate kinase 1 n=1 Tax=Salinilacustrithrix flava TaxID=2957203 RepID=UPI003D7C2C69|nr:polyphosphate kinase 1 [Acidimicrobiia bacterium EGI L10123]
MEEALTPVPDSIKQTVHEDHPGRWRRFIRWFTRSRRRPDHAAAPTGVGSTVEDAAGLDLRQRPERFFNRELSWLEFNARVLALATDDQVPLLERAKFLAIFSSNLDEFFQVRVAGLKDQLFAGVRRPSHDGRAPAEQLAAIRDVVLDLCRDHQQVFTGVVVAQLEREGIRLTHLARLPEPEREAIDRVFDEHVFPVLTPLAVDPGHPFPYISNLSLNLAVLVADPETGERRFARVKVPSNLDRFLRVPGTASLVPLEELIADRLDRLFPSMDVLEWSLFRVTRNADLTVEDNEADDLLEAVEMELRRRRFGRAVRVEIGADMSDALRDVLVRELDLAPEDVYVVQGLLDLTSLWSIHALERPDLKDKHWAGTTPWHAAGDGVPADFFAEIRRGDILVHHPYSSFHNTVEAFLRQASKDPGVVAIKMTLYRTSGDSSIIRSLVRAAESGKQVAVLVELKARFDEARNIEWAKALEEVGVHVVYGIVGLKTHTKTLLVVREERDGLRRYCHIGTGNYNPKTATIYEDLGLFTTDPAIGTDLSQLFNYLTGFSSAVDYEKLVVAPDHLRRRFEGLIAGEAQHGSGGRIVAKMNSLSDPAMIDALYAAAAAGVEVDLIVRGICCLRPGVPGLSENIRVRSIVGRYLEHSRIYRFANGAGTGRPLHLIGSADLMTRNINRRVEALTPVEAPELQERLDEILDVNLADDQLAWSLDGDGRWRRELGEAEGGVHTHVALQQAALNRIRHLAHER